MNDRQAEARPGHAESPGAARSEKRLEEMRQVVRLDTRPGVFDGQGENSIVYICRYDDLFI